MGTGKIGLVLTFYFPPGHCSRAPNMYLLLFFLIGSVGVVWVVATVVLAVEVKGGWAVLCVRVVRIVVDAIVGGNLVVGFDFGGGEVTGGRAVLRGRVVREVVSFVVGDREVVRDDVDKDGWIVVSDKTRREVVRFDKDGRVVLRDDNNGREVVRDDKVGRVVLRDDKDGREVVRDNEVGREVLRVDDMFDFGWDVVREVKGGRVALFDGF